METIETKTGLRALMRKLIPSILILLICFSFTSSFTHGTELTDKQSQLTEVNDKKAQASKELEEIAEKIKNQMEVLSGINNEITIKENEIADSEEKIQQKQADMEERQRNLNKRLRTMYKNGSVGFIDVLLGSNNISEFLSNIEMIQRIYRSDQNVMASLKKDYQDLKAQEEALIAQKQELSAKQAEAEKAREELQATQASAKKNFDELEQQSQALGNEIAALQAQYAPPPSSGGGSGDSGAPSGGGGGGFIWPVVGPITSDYTYRWHPIFGYYHGHTGIDIGVGYGTPIRAAQSGTVILSSWYGGYGNAVVIAHDSSLSTVYGHCQSLAVSAGQYVNQGDVIAYVGSTGWSTGPHLHFEVRVNGQHTSPWPYLP